MITKNIHTNLVGLITGTLILSIIMIGCGKEDDSPKNLLENKPQAPMVMIIKNQGDLFSQEVSGQVAKSLDYAKIPYFTVDLGIISQEFEIPQSVRSVVVSTELINYLPAIDLTEIVEFVSKGNALVFTGPFSSEETYFLQGIRQNADFAIDSTNTGVYLYKDIFPGMAGKTYNPRGISKHYGLKKNDFSSRVDIIAGTATDPETPFMVSNKIGLGEVITLNSYAIGEKYYRGYLFSALLKGMEGVPYQVANVSTIFLDDFPAPLYNQKIAPIDEEYDLTHADFVTTVWWPDMIALADTFNISYSAMTAFNYNANVVPPFDFQEWEDGLIELDQDSVEGSSYLARNIRDSRHELAFHGYNHFSLLSDEWPNVNFMISALQAARKEWRVDDLGELPTNYVPPTNQIDSMGMQAIIRGMPSINTMSSLYFGDIEFGGGREFDPDPYVPSRIFNYPRISSGFTMNEISLLDQQGMQLVTGIWNHFVHPDDVFQVTQREDDAFTSRNPLKLGWKDHPVYGYGLYQLLQRRLTLTQQLYPMNRYVTASEGAKRAEDWRRSFSHYSAEENELIVETAYRANYVPNYTDSLKYWYMFVPDNKAADVEAKLMEEGLVFERTGYWDGHLYQFMSNSSRFTLPNLEDSFYFDPVFVDNLITDEVRKFQRYNQPEGFFDGSSTEPWRDTRLEDAVKAWQRNPSYANQEQLITLSMEFDQPERAIEILENRLMDTENWAQNDMSRLITYYGYEGMLERAEEFLEMLWAQKQSAEVIALKDLAVQELGLFGESFDKKWGERAVSLNPNDYLTILNYTKSIESQDNWPIMKSNLRRLLQMRPETDSLYAFSLQRSFYYDKPDSTIAFLEEFPPQSYSQLMPFATNLAFIYAYDLEQYEKALFWADNVPDFDERQKLYWISQLGLKELYLARAKQMILNSPMDDSLRSFVGTNLFYEGFPEASYEVMYPLFENDREKGFTADTLMRNEIGFMAYEQQKSFYKQYPKFFDSDQVSGLLDTYRWTEGLKASLYGEYQRDNFENNRARAGASVQIGNRRDVTHLFKTDHLVLADQRSGTTSYLNYQGLGYEFGHLMNDQRLQLRLGANLLAGERDFIPEGLVSVGYSKDSTYSSLQLSGGSVLTATSLENDYYFAQLQGYRQDFWANGKLSTALSTLSKYYSNSVFEYGGQLRLFYDPKTSGVRLRPMAELGYADATKSYLSGIPFYTPDQYFSQGLGVDLQYRKPDTFDFRTQLSGELMGKHERRDGYFLTGRVQLEHKFRNFWEIRLGTEFSTSKVYRSNRMFFTVSHYFRNSLNKN